MCTRAPFKNSSRFIAEYYSSIRQTMICPSIDGHLVYLQFGTITNTAAVNIHVQMFVLGKMPRNGIAGSFGRHVFDHGHFHGAPMQVSEAPHCVYLTYKIRYTLVTWEQMIHTLTRRPHQAAAASFQSSQCMERVPSRESLPA